MKRFALVWILLALFNIGCARTTPSIATPTTTPSAPRVFKSGDYDQSLVFAGRTRTYTVHLPRGIGDELALPLVIVLHGGGGNSANAARMTGFSALADKEQFIVVYPDGTGRLDDKLLTWNSGNCCGYALDRKIDDVGFIRALIETLQRDYPIDARRIYATGMSNGGMMSYRIGCELSDKIAAIAPVAGALNVECKPSAPIAVIAFHGTNDQHVLYDGGKPKIQADPHPREDQPVAYAMNFWAQHNRCATTPARAERGNVTRDTYANCAYDTGVELYTIKDGGHAWPSGQRGSPRGDMPTREISATNVMWEFFKRHPK
ncbi:MAG: polyhydroxybutyrate depolymerase [Chloroflexi bacterium]|nr:polyhydroxybutyrate depolymerase [Chloroflexota bacterium]